ncbi:uncharacterized protein LOC128188013 [Crassostrea angulata]|uniref:uncharacterized protein LOC128188013 n=1 Tax=Magallana angulata TaxID=2784310 RepID=UPI0022B12FF7|nr:uncharacterized protein LOC128188013 [Crassostrea angulata]
MAYLGLAIYVICLVVISEIFAIPPKYYMDQRCGKTLTIGSSTPSIRLDLTRYSKYDNRMNCRLTVRASNISATSRTRLMLVFRKIDIKGYDFIACDESDDVLYIHDGSLTSDPPVKGLARALCGEREPLGSYVSTGDSLTLRFKSNFWNTDDGFKLLITPFHTGSCLGSEYRCNGGQCISGGNKCDNYRQCGESIDECEVTRTLSWIAGVVVGVIFILVIIGVGVFCLRRFLRRRNNSGGVVKYSAAPQPVTAPPMYQQPGSVPPYQQPGTTPGYYPPAPEPQGYPPQNAAYPPPYPQQPQGYPPASNPYPYGAPMGQ